MANVAGYDQVRNMTFLDVCFITKSSVRQRRGRAGRTQPGNADKRYRPSYPLLPFFPLLSPPSSHAHSLTLLFALTSPSSLSRLPAVIVLSSLPPSFPFTNDTTSPLHPFTLSLRTFQPLRPGPM